MQRACVDKPRRLPHPRQTNASARPDCCLRGSPLPTARALPNGPAPRVSTRPAVWRCVAPATVLTLVPEAEGRGAVISRRAHVLGCQPASGELSEAKRRAEGAPRTLPGRSAGSPKTERERWPGTRLALRRHEKDEKKCGGNGEKKPGRISGRAGAMASGRRRRLVKRPGRAAVRRPENNANAESRRRSEGRAAPATRRKRGTRAGGSGGERGERAPRRHAECRFRDVFRVFSECGVCSNGQLTISRGVGYNRNGVTQHGNSLLRHYVLFDLVPPVHARKEKLCPVLTLRQSPGRGSSLWPWRAQRYQGIGSPLRRQKPLFSSWQQSFS